MKIVFGSGMAIEYTGRNLVISEPTSRPSVEIEAADIPDLLKVLVKSEAMEGLLREAFNEARDLKWQGPTWESFEEWYDRKVR